MAGDTFEEVLVIERAPAWRAIDLREIWRYRELLYFLVWRDVKVRYKQTLLGITWAVLQPLLAMLVFAFFFGRVARFPSNGVPYPLFAYAGLLPWMFFATAVSAGSTSLVGSAHLVTKVYFPRVLIPIAPVLTALVDFAFAFLMLLPLAIWMRTPLSISALFWIPIAMLACILVAVGLSIWLSALVVRFRDLRHVIPFVMQVWLFATPIVYPLSFVPDRYRPLVRLNPMASVVEVFRDSLLGGETAWRSLAFAAVAGIVLIFSGGVHFRRLERTFADVL